MGCSYKNNDPIKEFYVENSININTLVPVNEDYFSRYILFDDNVNGFNEYFNLFHCNAYQYSERKLDSIRENYLENSFKNQYQFFILDTVRVLGLIEWEIIMKYSNNELYDITPNIELYGHILNQVTNTRLTNMFKLAGRANEMLIVSSPKEFKTYIYRDSTILTIETNMICSDISTKKKTTSCFFDTIKNFYKIETDSSIRFFKRIELYEER